MAKLICTVELSKERGVTLKVENADARITQTITMDGTTLTMTVAGPENTSSWAQTADGIAIDCKDFTLTASNSITCTAAKTAKYVTTKSDTTIESGGKIVQAATGDVAVSGKTIELEGATAASMKGNTVTLEGLSQARLTGAQVLLAADAQLSLESTGMAKLQGGTTTIGGSLIKAG